MRRVAVSSLLVAPSSRRSDRSPAGAGASRPSGPAPERRTAPGRSAPTTPRDRRPAPAPATRRPAGATAVGGADADGPGGVRGVLGKTRTNLRQIGEVYRISSKTDRKLPLWLAGAFLVGFLVVLGIGFLLHAPGYFAFIGVVVGILAALVVFGRRAERAAYAQLEGRPGAAAAAMNTLKRGWTIEPAIAGTRTLEVVHRAVGRPGIVLVGEGPGRGRLSQLLANEVRRHQRVAPGTPVLTLQVGSADGQVPVAGLPRHLRKLAAVLTPGDVRELNQRLRALRLGTPQQPHGPLPRGAKLPKGLRPPTDADTTPRTR